VLEESKGKQKIKIVFNLRVNFKCVLIVSAISNANDKYAILSRLFKISSYNKICGIDIVLLYCNCSSLHFLVQVYSILFVLTALYIYNNIIN